MTTTTRATLEKRRTKVILKKTTESKKTKNNIYQKASTFTGRELATTYTITRGYSLNPRFQVGDLFFCCYCWGM